jgi:hypothetical protein
VRRALILLGAGFLLLCVVLPKALSWYVTPGRFYRPIGDVPDTVEELEACLLPASESQLRWIGGFSGLVIGDSGLAVRLPSGVHVGLYLVGVCAWFDRGDAVPTLSWCQDYGHAPVMPVWIWPATAQAEALVHEWEGRRVDADEGILRAFERLVAERCRMSATSMSGRR